MSDRQTSWSSVIFQWIVIIGGIVIFVKTDADVPWKKYIVDLFTTSVGSKVVSARDSIEVGNYKVWKWKNVDGADEPILTVHFKNFSPKGLSVYVLDGHDLAKLERHEQPTVFECLSRENVSAFDCTRILGKNIEELAFVVYNPAESISDRFGLSQPSSYEFDVFVVNGKSNK